MTSVYFANRRPCNVILHHPTCNKNKSHSCNSEKFEIKLRISFQSKPWKCKMTYFIFTTFTSKFSGRISPILFTTLHGLHKCHTPKFQLPWHVRADLTYFSKTWSHPNKNSSWHRIVDTTRHSLIYFQPNMLKWRSPTVPSPTETTLSAIRNFRIGNYWNLR